MLADKASFLIYKGFVSTIGALLTLCLGTVLNVFLQGTLYTVLPGVDALAIELERTYEFDNLLDGHTITEYA